ncbi:ankyrin repeat domain-containing protein [Algoriphagus sp. D3-2-R+10]|uniref:ankyrin repeat domain-containing protein n=1 Tax=Algoriphagus aurantiacus TaxID=3103948 RepID=UPI002B3CAEC9|nr:ankyrin repeat domain-containing protein [Algoriphagus sp. D3-2-R+10]MEB2777569.1 ankyrin repeat domain-containing protein [Algoriphagus sp. D3-2-R+10]
MNSQEIAMRIASGRTDTVLELLTLPNWKELIISDEPSLFQWLIFYDDVTGLRLVEKEGLDVKSLNLNNDLCDAAFFGHWKTCDFLLKRGADVNYQHPSNSESPLHCALCKAGRPYYQNVVRLLLECGADVNLATNPNLETGSFMRDVKTCGETPLHRAAAYADEETIRLLLDRGADKEKRDSNGDTPLAWGSIHLRPAKILSLLCYGEHKIGKNTMSSMISDHGNGWGNGMENKFIGQFIRE